ncbi:putative bifunctional diguanylate cyclase/phosphodiesterase [Caballeronia sp. 15711]|uniref:putative bifunctional diguanylate cyclase/phosphodiesterase n=1 Tax=Caballeronia sp. 15711 TaxID=3391029 RepID=UPI0039E4327F
MQSAYDPWLVVLSLIVAALASYTVLDISARISLLETKRQRRAWIAGGAGAMGLGIWSMHFVGMIAFSLPILLGYDLKITGASLLIAIVVSYFALNIIVGRSMSTRRLVVGGILMGIGIAGMHYAGMAAMRMEPGIIYDPVLFAASIGIAIVASIAALWIARNLSDSSQRYVIGKRVGAALVMGIAITGMHYTGMAAAAFPLGAICAAANGVNAQWLATTVTIFTFAILIVTLVLSRLDTRAMLLAGSVSALNGQVLRMATFDTLTDLPNRRTLTERMEVAVATASRNQTLFAVLFLDLDGFKMINDSLGHSVGDEVLKAFSQRLLRCVRGGDTVARLGGDEFVVMLTDIQSAKDAETMASSMLERMRHGVWSDGQPLQVVPSVGISLYPQDGTTVETLLMNADAAMYEAKRGGRGSYRFFEASMNEAATRTLQIQQALHDALELGYFSLNFQPKFNGKSGGLVGAEALIRLNHPQIGSLPPMEFIPISERSGQIVAIGAWVLREACRQIRRWALEGRPPIKVAINLSPRQLTQPDLVERLTAIVLEERVSCEQIMFEITETVAMQDAPRTIEMIRQFQKNGFDIAIDDFGTGYSSLAYLQRFRVKQLKIDRFFTNGLDEPGNEGSAIVSAIIALAHSLEMDVVAEGVETATQLGKLQSMMCDEIQGFLVGRPLSADAFGLLMTGEQAMSV